MAKKLTIDLSNDVLNSAGKTTSSGKSTLLVTENVSFDHTDEQGNEQKIRVQYFVYRTPIKKKESAAPRHSLVKLS